MLKLITAAVIRLTLLAGAWAAQDTLATSTQLQETSAAGAGAGGARPQHADTDHSHHQPGATVSSQDWRDRSASDVRSALRCR